MAGYPVAADLVTLLEGAGLTIPDGFDTESILEAAIGEWERRTGFKPFYVAPDADETTLRLDPPGPRQARRVPSLRGGSSLLPLGAGFASVTEIRTGISNGDAEGEIREEGTDYELEPYAAAVEGRPYTMARFTYNLWGRPRSISVTGLLGFTSDMDLHPEATRGILELAGSTFCRQVKQGLMAGVIDWKEDDVSERMSIELIQKLGLEFAAAASAKVVAYKRLI